MQAVIGLEKAFMVVTEIGKFLLVCLVSMILFSGMALFMLM